MRLGRDHPRIRGEHQKQATDPLLEGRIIPAYAGSTAINGGFHTGVDGSSPHTRGAHFEITVDPVQLGIIPAYAGSTQDRDPRAVAISDHPRIRGEHPNNVSHTTRHGGSSPHTRGARRRPVADLPRGRIIPAYAGSTSVSCGLSGRGRDHPRIRGEHESSTSRSRPSPGSSPHTRGALILARNAAGRAPDHPRIRGEHLGRSAHPRHGRGSSPHTRGAPTMSMPKGAFSGIIPAYAGSTGGIGPDGCPRPGSSPHTRGARFLSIVFATSRRIIPAYAGSTRLSGSDGGRGGDHPRIRGEHWSPGGVNAASIGSSPHTRGARRPSGGGMKGEGIIPAYAGSTRAQSCTASPAPDHPRIRGEHSFRDKRGGAYDGSSPHTRGARRDPSRIPWVSRIIPAYAGSTPARRRD